MRLQRSESGWQKCWRGYCLVAVLLQGPLAAAKPQSPIEDAMTLASGALEMFQTGAVMRKDFNFDLPVGSVRGNSEFGAGRVMRRDSDSDEDSEERRKRRRKRAIPFDIGRFEVQSNSISELGTQRGKRTPCHNMNSTPTAAPPDYGAVEDGARRRARRQRLRTSTKKQKSSQGKQTDRSRSSKPSKSKKKKATAIRVRRQVAPVGETQSKAEQAVLLFTEQATQFAQRLQGVWESTMAKMRRMVQNMRETFQGGAPTN